MPDGGYGVNIEDVEQVADALAQTDGLCGLIVEWCAAYATARAAGATPKEAARAAYIEWDL